MCHSVEEAGSLWSLAYIIFLAMVHVVVVGWRGLRELAAADVSISWHSGQGEPWAGGVTKRRRGCRTRVIYASRCARFLIYVATWLQFVAAIL